MYVAPRPREEDDPLFAVRLASGAVIGLLVAILVQSPMPMIMPALTVGLMAGMRKAFDAKKAIGGPIAMMAMIVLFSLIVSLTRPMPAVLITIIGVFCVAAYYLILRTGNPIGMLVLIVTVLMSVMGMNSIQAMEMMRDAFVEGSCAALVTIPLLYALLPPATGERFVEVYEPAAGGYHGRRALIRGGVLLLLTLWLYTVVDASSLMLSIAAVFVMVFPTREQLFAEARERTFATLLGGGLALLIIGVFSVAAHLSILLSLVFLGCLFLASRMMAGRHPPMVYQFALSAMIALIVGALTTQAPLDATVLRVSLTLIGAVSAAFLTSLLEALLVPGQLPKASPATR
ncbi:MAG: FUSC family protein [Porticoccaceae bacterium]